MQETYYAVPEMEGETETGKRGERMGFHQRKRDWVLFVNRVGAPLQQKDLSNHFLTFAALRLRIRRYAGSHSRYRTLVIRDRKAGLLMLYTTR